MIRFFLLLLVAFAVGGCVPTYAGLIVSPGTPNHTHTDANTGGATLALTAVPTSTASCYLLGPYFIRSSPDLCTNDEPGLIASALTRDVCYDFVGGNAWVTTAGATAVVVAFLAQANAANVAGVRREVSIRVWPINNCSGANYIDVVTAYAVEWSATASGYALGVSTSVFTFNVASGISFRLSDDAGNTGSGFWSVVGYH